MLVDSTNEGIRGVENFKATNLPAQLGLRHTWNRELVEKVGEITGKEARLLGYTNVYAPISTWCATSAEDATRRCTGRASTW